MMTALLDNLAAFKPDIITVENVSGEQCEHLKRYTGVYPESFDTWCQNTDAAQKAVGLDTPAAAAEIRKTLASWPAMPCRASPASRALPGRRGKALRSLAMGKIASRRATQGRRHQRGNCQTAGTGRGSSRRDV